MPSVFRPTTEPSQQSSVKHFNISSTGASANSMGTANSDTSNDPIPPSQLSLMKIQRGEKVSISSAFGFDKCEFTIDDRLKASFDRVSSMLPPRSEEHNLMRTIAAQHSGTMLMSGKKLLNLESKVRDARNSDVRPDWVGCDWVRPLDDEFGDVIHHLDRLRLAGTDNYLP